MTRRAAPAVGILLTVLVLSACAPPGDPGWTPPTWTANAVEVAVVETPPVVDLDAQPDLVASLTSTRVRNEAAGVQARFATLPGVETAQAFNAAMRGFVRDAVTARASAAGVAYRPAASPASAGLGDRACVVGSTELAADDLLSSPDLGPPGASGLAVVCDVLVASGPMFAQRIRAVSGAVGAVTADATTVLYTDTETGETSPPEGLWVDTAAEELRVDVVEALRRDAGALTLGTPTADDGAGAVIDTALASTVPDGDGGFVFTIPAGFESAALTALGVSATTEPLTIHVPAPVASSLASPFGLRVLETAGLPYAGPAALQASREPVDCTFVPCVALTYDDGPTGLTGLLLDTFAELRVPATFYMLGSSAAGRPDTVRRVAAEGHQIGNHTWNHPQLPTVDDAGVADQLGRTRDLLRSLSGQPVASFRPPYGEYSDRVLKIAGEPAILWNVDTRDWAGPADDVLRATAIDGARPGGIILFHDTHERSVRVAPDVVRGLRDRGFTLVTVTQLFGGQLPATGAWRSAP